LTTLVTGQPFEQVVAEHGAVVWRVCRALLTPADADDAWSETFLAALRAYPDLRADSNVRGWLVTIAHNKAIDQLRRARRVPRTEELSHELPSHDAVPEPADEDLRAALVALPPKQRDAVIGHHLAGLPYAEVGRLIGSSEAAARRSAADGIAALRSRLRKEPPR
jgi:RNA polymerase sigma factor (sigma-70 family)